MPTTSHPRRRGRALSDTEREQRRSEQRQLVIDSVERLRSSEGWRDYLKARRHFHDYSATNLLLVIAQRPDATRVAGFKAWLDLGYCVRKGSRSIKIWARCDPSRAKIDAWRRAGAHSDDRPRPFYKLVSVFDVSDVDPLPPPAQPAPLAAPPVPELCGDSHQRLLGRLGQLADEVGYRLEYADTGPAEGWCNHKTKVIRVAERLEPNGRLAVGIHELAHALVALELKEQRTTIYDYAEEELIVESVAWCCCQTIGLDSTDASIPYLASWSQKASLDVLKAAAVLTGQIADRIEAVLLDQDLAADPSGQPSEGNPGAGAKVDARGHGDASLITQAA